MGERNRGQNHFHIFLSYPPGLAPSKFDMIA